MQVWEPIPAVLAYRHGFTTKSVPVTVSIANDAGVMYRFVELELDRTDFRSSVMNSFLTPASLAIVMVSDADHSQILLKQDGHMAVETCLLWTSRSQLLLSEDTVILGGRRVLLYSMVWYSMV